MYREVLPAVGPGIIFELFSLTKQSHPPVASTSSHWSTFLYAGIFFVVGFAVLLTGYIVFLYARWKQRFAHKVPRFHPTSPSFRRRPHLIEPIDVGDSNNITHVRSADDSEFNSVAASSKWQRLRKTQSRRGTARRTVAETNAVIDGVEVTRKSRLSDFAPAESLDLDHVYISFTKYLFPMLFVYPNLILGFVAMQLSYRMRRFVTPQKTLTNPLRDADIPKLSAMLILNSHFMIYYTGKKIDDSGLVIGHFYLPKLYGFDDHGERFEKSFSLFLDLDKPCVTAGYLGDRALSDMDIFIVLSFYLTTGHGLVHMMSNWGTNVDSACNFVRRMSVLTVAYNNFATGAPGLAGTQKRLLGAYKKLDDPTSTFFWIVTSYGADGVRSHQNIVELAPYSDFADFVIKVRNFFINTFENYQHDFLGIDGEALFISSILHSLDHAVVAELVPPRPEFIAAVLSDSDLDMMGEWVRNTAAGISTKLSGLVFPHFFKEASHPFYQKVYAFARRINPTFADLMRCCVIL